MRRLLRKKKPDEPGKDGVDPSWLKFKVKRSDPAVVSQYCPDRPYLEFQVPPGLKHVCRIEFVTVSHDQGFSGDSGSVGTYNFCNSWFDAAVIAPTGHDRVDRPRFQDNVHGVWQKKKHSNTWDYRSEDASIRKFLACIQENDLICVIPKARHVAWLNYVYDVEMRIFGEEEDRTQLAQRVGSLKMHDSDQHKTVYRQLNEAANEIRLLTLEPGLSDDLVVCTLQYVNFTDAEVPAYEALSYCWGDSEDRREIKVASPAHAEEAAQDAEMNVTASLAQAFRHLRYEDRPRTMWADAVCINQLDLPERSKQVALMPKIYSRATGILVWLGESTPGAVKSIKDTKMIRKRFAQSNVHPRKDEELRAAHCPVLDGGPLLVDSQLFEYEYFHRTWVLQEVFNARTVTVHCGEYVLRWAPILRLNQCLIRSMLIPNPVGKHVLPALFAGLFEITTVSPKTPKLTYKPMVGALDILDVVSRGLDLESSDPRDKLFALLSFGKETSALESLPPELKPDYDKNAPLVFAEFTRWWILTHRSLKILSAVQMAFGRTWQSLLNSPTPLESLDHPTWSWWYTGKSFWRRGTLGMAPECTYSATKGMPPEVALIDNAGDPLKLALTGHTIGPIASIDRYPYFAVMGHVEACEDVTCSIEPLHDAYTNLFDPIDEWGTWRYGATHQTPQVQALRRANTPEELQRKRGDHYMAHRACANETGSIECHGACFFRLADSKQGLCPPGTEEGDIVVVLYGGDVPYVLRRRPSKADGRAEYYFVGECYLQNYMYGLAVGEEKQEQEKPARETFHLV